MYIVLLLPYEVRKVILNKHSTQITTKLKSFSKIKDPLPFISSKIRQKLVGYWEQQICSKYNLISTFKFELHFNCTKK